MNGKTGGNRDPRRGLIDACEHLLTCRQHGDGSSRRCRCGNPGCPRKTFAEAARHAGISWPVAHHAFTAAAGPGSRPVPGHP